jgi:DNA-binding transcriptional MerR regulator
MITITDLAARHGLTLRALRFYEQKGLISPQRAGRTRLYSEEDAQKLAVILEAAALGFTLTEIHGMVVKGAKGYSLALSPETARKQLEIMHARMIETQTAVERLRDFARERAA